ncbi:hypothetical protein [Nonomuraea typhae]|uniref:Sigma-70 family RNA polymerase sigma factor n=1 Tax=Nonomuraea typhae TaxID=2603600 RepID=A0ABW7YVR7_9ACTN
MNDRMLVEALRADDPGALAALYDTYAEGIYQYCWSLLLSSDSAQVALRDTLIAAEAHIFALAEPERLRPWLYALARGACAVRRLSAPADAPAGASRALTEAPEPDEPGDADLRIMAWNATHSLPADDRELLELSTRHELPTADLAVILGLAPRQVELAEEAARERLREEVTAEFLARKVPYDCPRRARILAGFAGELTAEMRRHLVRHVAHCELCAPHHTRAISAAKVFELLPAAPLPESLRVRVMSCFIDPELVPYRRYVARRAGILDAAGFPRPGEKKSGKRHRALAGALAAVVTVIAIGIVFYQFGIGRGDLSGLATGAFPATGEPPGIRLPWAPDPQDTTIRVEPIPDNATTRPIHGIAATDLPAVTPPGTAPPATRTPSSPAPSPSRATRPPTSSASPTPAPSTPGRAEPGIPGGGQATRDPQGRPTRTPCPTTPPPATPPSATPSPVTPSASPEPSPTRSADTPPAAPDPSAS